MDVKIKFPSILNYFDRVELEETSDYMPDYLFNTMSDDLKEKIDSFVPKASVDKRTPRKPALMTHIFHGSWGMGKSTLLILLAQYAHLKNFLVFYSKNCKLLDKNEANIDFMLLNKLSISHWKTEIAKDARNSFLIKFLDFDNLANNAILANLNNLRHFIPICVVLDKWDLMDPNFDHLYSLDGSLLTFVSGSGGWKPQMGQQRVPNRARYNKYHLKMERLNRDMIRLALSHFLKCQVSNSLVEKVLQSTEGVFVLLNKVYDIIKVNPKYLPFQNEYEDDLVKDLVATIKAYFSAVVNGLISIDLNGEDQITRLLAAAHQDFPEIDAHWLESGVCKEDGSFFHNELQRQLSSFYKIKENVKAVIENLTYKTEDAFEYLFQYLFSMPFDGQLKLHSGCLTGSLKGECTIQWNKYFEFDLSNIVPDDFVFEDLAIYHLQMAGANFPAIDFCCKNGRYIYAIQVSVQKTREDHDRAPVGVILKKQGNLPSALDIWLKSKYAAGDEVEIRYVYLSPFQFKRSQKQDEYWVPTSFEYLRILADDTQLYTFLLSHYTLKERPRKRAKIDPQ